MCAARGIGLRQVGAPLPPDAGAALNAQAPVDLPHAGTLSDESSDEESDDESDVDNSEDNG